MITRNRLKVAVKTLLFASAIILWFAYMRANHPLYWKSIHSQVLAPFKRWPRELTNFRTIGAYVYSMSAVLALDWLILRKKSALAEISKITSSVRLDLALAGLSILGFAWVLPALISGGFTAILPRFFSTYKINLISDIQPTILKLFIYFLITDFLIYWHHRTFHKFETLWKFHTLHHSATSFTVFTGNRVHPVEFVLKIPFVVIPMLFIGIAPTGLVGIWYLRRIFDLLQHSFVPFTYGKFGKWVIFSPVGHQIHHSVKKEHFDSNYGDIFTIWDHLFDTWYSGGETVEKIGIPNNKFNSGNIFQDLARPFMKDTVTTDT